jgi:hypothetical protein
MPRREADPQDPLEWVGIRLPTADDSALREMVACFAEEFLRLGHAPHDVLALFRDPFYAGPHEAYRRLGESRIRETIETYHRLLHPVENGEGDPHGDGL